MPTITFLKSGKTHSVPEGSNLMKSILQADMPVASSCGGDGVCGKCRIKISEGAQNLSPEGTTEAEIKDIHDVPKKERISCQVTILGDITIDTNYW